MTYRKKLIEVALPLEAINKASAREKSIRHGHPSTLHLWWARRPLAACRAVIFASLVDDPDDPDAHPEFVEACKKLPKGKNAAANDTPRQRLFDFIERLVTWEATTDEDILNQARELIQIATDGNPPPLLDPFAGGGSIPLEAQRLGLEAHASDLNPVAVMINKALIEIPPKFSNMPPVNPRDREGTGGSAIWKGASGLAADVSYYGELLEKKVWERVGDYYPDLNNEKVIAWLWSRTVKSPNPVINSYVPLLRSYWLSNKKGKEIWLSPKIDRKNRVYHFEVISGRPSSRELVSNGTKEGRATFRCLFSGAIITADYLRKEGKADRIGSRLIAIITEGNRGKKYHPADSYHEHIAFDAKISWKPEYEMANNPRHMSPPIYGFKYFSDLFSQRQLMTLATFYEEVQLLRDQIDLDFQEAKLSGIFSKIDGYADALITYLVFTINRLVDKSSTFSWWMSSAEKMAPTFSRQALSIVWDYAEMNPFCNVTSNYSSSVEWVVKAIKSLPYPSIQGISNQKNATETINDLYEPIVSTDPPYYDNVPYADISDYFYVWMRPILVDIYPKIFSTLLVPKRTEIVADIERSGSREEANQHFENSLNKALSNIYAIAAPSYPMTIYYAFKQSEFVRDSNSDYSNLANTGWEKMLKALLNSGFMITGTWPIRTERGGGLRNLNRNSLASSIVLVCRPRPLDTHQTSRSEFINELRKEIPVSLSEMQSGNLAPVDLAQASIGPGMAVYSRYNKVLEPNGDRMTVRSALQLINQELDAYLAKQEGYIDEDSRFAVAWFEQFGFKDGPFGQADVLARAKNTSVDGLVNAGILKSGAGKTRLLHWSELDPGWDPLTDKRLPTWEATHHLIEQLNSHGEEGTAQLLAKIPSDLATEARQLAYRLYSICERKGWSEHARDYNALVVSWGASQEQAREYRDQYQQGKLFG